MGRDPSPFEVNLDGAGTRQAKHPTRPEIRCRSLRVQDSGSRPYLEPKALTRLLAYQSLEKQLLELTAAIENCEDMDRACIDSVDDPVGSDDELSPASNSEVR